MLHALIPSATTRLLPRRVRGYSLVELMVSITMGLIVLAALVAILANNSRARAEIDRSNQQTENGRYALQVLGDDLHNAGYFAEFNPGNFASLDSQLTPLLAVPNPCAWDTASLNADLEMPVQGYDNVTAATAPACLADVRAGTDVVVVRRASTCAVGDAGCDALVNGDPYFQASTCGTELQQNGIAHFVLDRVQGALTLHQIDCATAAPWHQYRTHVYFVANDDKPGDGVPTLKRAELGGGGFTIVPLVEGIDNLQLEYGIDTSVPSVGSPAVYTSDPNSYNGCAGTTCVGNWANTVTVKIHVLARNTTTTPGYNDTKTYTLGLNADGTVNTVGPFGDAYKRHILEATVRLNNIAGRNSP